MASAGEFRPGAAVVPASQVEVSVACKNLKDKDTFSKSDPMCVLYVKEFGAERFREFGRTEMIKDTLNPDFVKKFIVEYFFEQSQKLLFEVYDVDSPSGKLDKHDFLGSIECTLGEIVGSSGSGIKRNLKGPQGSSQGNWGSIIVRAEEVSSCKDLVTLHFKGTKLDKKDFFGKSDPFLVLSRCNEDNSYTVVHKTEVIKNTLNPTWRPFTVKARVLCNGDYDRSIKFDCYDWDSDGSSHDLIGSFVTNLRKLTSQNLSENDYECIHPKKKAKKKSYKHSGKVSLIAAKLEEEYTFLEFVRGGMELNFTVAVDFTASNGNPTQPTSLHYINPYQPNHYARALQAVGEIIQDYDSDKQFPALGFGARIPPDGRVSHEFFLNGNPQNPYCNGIGAIMQAYQQTLRTVQLYGPTNFAPVINHVAKFASAYQDGSHYFVLLILTDGVITDMPDTKSAIVEASKLPLSIIIVGIGEAEFDAMEELDSDDKRLSAGYGRYAERDIVQFVPFREFIGGKYGANLQMSQAYLAKEVLAEVPDQVTGYMKKIGMKPKPPVQRPPSEMQAPPGQAPPPAQAPPAAGGYPSQAPPSQAPYPGQQAPYPGQPAPYGQPPPGQAPYPQAGGYAPPPGQAPPPGYGAPPGAQPRQSYPSAPGY